MAEMRSRSRRLMITAETQSRSADDARRAAQMAAAQAGDRAAYEALLRDFVPFITVVDCRQGVPPDRRDDVVQDVLLTIHRARQTYDPARSFNSTCVTASPLARPFLMASSAGSFTSVSLGMVASC